MIQHAPDSTALLTVDASVGKHLALAPVGFGVIEVGTHDILYANAQFRHLLATDQVRVGDRAGRDDGQGARAPSLATLLDDAARRTRAIRDVVLEPPFGAVAKWSCSIWPVADARGSRRLVVEVRDMALIESVRERQRAIAQELLLGALRAQDAAGDAASAGERARFLAQASRDLSLSLDESATRKTMQRLSLPRPGTWCIVDVVESNGGIHRLAVIHPDPAKQPLARLLEEQWPSTSDESMDAATVMAMRRPTVVTRESEAELVRAVHGQANLRILRELGFGSLLVVPLIVRGRVQGAITFVSPEEDPEFSPDEMGLAIELGARCAMALDNARLYQETDALRLAAEAASRSKGEFLGMISHELRTPLNAIGGFTELLEMEVEGPVTEKQRTALARIKANQQHLLTLITEILNFVRIESGRMAYHLGRVSLPHALADVSGMLSGAAKGKKLTLATAPGGEDVTGWADPDRVRQVLLNLIMNAVKYTPAGGTITLSCGAVDDAVVAHVADTGPGIEPKQLESIFEPFVQHTTGLIDRQGGVGLGLPISRDLARAMNGDVTVESTVGTGSRFTLSLPRAPQADSEPPTPTQAKASE